MNNIQLAIIDEAVNKTYDDVALYTNKSRIRLEFTRSDDDGRKEKLFVTAYGNNPQLKGNSFIVEYSNHFNKNSEALQFTTGNLDLTSAHIVLDKLATQLQMICVDPHTFKTNILAKVFGYGVKQSKIQDYYVAMPLVDELKAEPENEGAKLTTGIINRNNDGDLCVDKAPTKQWNKSSESDVNAIKNNSDDKDTSK